MKGRYRLEKEERAHTLKEIVGMFAISILGYVLVVLYLSL